MATSDLALLHQMDDFILDGKHHEATDAYCRLVAARPEDAARITTHVMTTAAPYLHVPAHHKLLPNGEFCNVNYDHTVLGIRAGLRLMPWLSERERYLTLAQAVYYVPQGLDVWEQLECGFPGHYAREQEKCAEDLLQANKRLHCHFEDQEPLVEGSVDERFQRMLARSSTSACPTSRTRPSSTRSTTTRASCSAPRSGGRSIASTRPTWPR